MNELPLLNNIKPFSREEAITRKSGIAKSGFESKELGQYAINPSLDCECKCLYCSSHCVLGRSPIYRDHVADWWETDVFVYYENIVDAVGRDAIRLDGRDIEVVMSSVVDPWQSGLVNKGTPRAILDHLAPTSLRIRLLTKMAAVVRDLPYVADLFGDRGTVGTSIPILDPELSRIIEPFATPVQRRHDRILGTARELGLRRYVMGCPILPGSYSDDQDFARKWAKIAHRYEPECIWFEPLNGRGKNLDVLEEGVRSRGLDDMAQRVSMIRTMRGWTAYTVELLGWVQRFARQFYDPARVRFLLYQSMLTEDGRRQIEANDETVIWL